MQPTSVLCRAQEALHRSRAASTSLTNVRAVADQAAAAWAKEATLAEQREQRQARTRLTAAELVEDEDELDAPGGEMFNENPDRGYPAI